MGTSLSFLLLLIAAVPVAVSFLPLLNHRSPFVVRKIDNAATGQEIVESDSSNDDNNWENPAELPTSMQDVINNDGLFEAVMKYGDDYPVIAKSNYAYKHEDSPIEFLVGQDGTEERQEELQQFLSNYPEGGSAKEQLKYILDFLDAKWQKVSVVLSSDEGDSEPVTVSELKGGLDNVSNQLSAVLFTCGRGFGVSIYLCGPNRAKKFEYGLTLFFDKFSTKIAQENVAEALEQTVADGLGLGSERDSTTAPGNELPPPYFEGYKGGLVDMSDPNPDRHLLNDQENDSVLVVAGESGSGKSFFSGYGIHEGVPRLFLKLTDEDIKKVDRYKPMSDDEKEWSDYVKAGLSQLKDSQDRDEKALYDAFQIARCNLQVAPNDWAWDVVEGMIARLPRSASFKVPLTGWFYGSVKAEPLDRFLLVIDEVGRDLDLAYGLVDDGLRRLTEALVERGRAERVGLVLCGTNLDRLRTTTTMGASSDERLRLGYSDPRKSQVVVMQNTNLERLRGLLRDDIQFETLEKGLYSRVCATNVRILNRALLPFLASIYAAHEDDRVDRQATQVRLCNSRASMMFIPSVSFHLNNLREMDSTARQRLFRRSFAFFLREGTKRIAKEEYPKCVECCLEVEEDDDIFQRGIATCNPDETSDALKFICAARGFAAPVVLTSNGYLRWEDFVKLHLQRLLECGGRTVRQIVLQGSWPPAGEGPWDEELTPEHKEDVCAIASAIKANEGAVLTTAVPNAQSPDAIVLIPIEPSAAAGKGNGHPCDYVWELHQSINYASYWPTASDCFPSLGVDPSEFLCQGDKEDDEKRKESISAMAERSRKGFQKLKREVERELAQTPAANTKFLEDVVHVVDIPLLPRCDTASQGGIEFMRQARERNIRVMTREFFEPTISACRRVLKSNE